jgi:hypothetical protein
MAEISLQQREIVGERLVATDVALAQAAKTDIGPHVQNERPRCPIRNLIFSAQDLLDVVAALSVDTRYSSRPSGLVVGGDSLELPTSWV